MWGWARRSSGWPRSSGATTDRHAWACLPPPGGSSTNPGLLLTSSHECQQLVTEAAHALGWVGRESGGYINLSLFFLYLRSLHPILLQHPLPLSSTRLACHAAHTRVAHSRLHHLILSCTQRHMPCIARWQQHTRQPRWWLAAGGWRTRHNQAQAAGTHPGYFRCRCPPAPCQPGPGWRCCRQRRQTDHRQAQPPPPLHAHRGCLAWGSRWHQSPRHPACRQALR